MAVLNNGITNVQDLLSGEVTGTKYMKIAVGTSDTPVDGTETALTGQLDKDIESFNVFAGGFIQFNATLAAGDPAMTIKEMGLVNDDGVLCHRVVVTPANKVDGVTYALSYKIKIS